MAERISDKSKSVILNKIKGLYQTLEVLADIGDPTPSFNPLLNRAEDIERLALKMGINQNLIDWTEETGIKSADQIVGKISPNDAQHIERLGALDKHKVVKFVNSFDV